MAAQLQETQEHLKETQEKLQETQDQLQETQEKLEKLEVEMVNTYSIQSVTYHIYGINIDIVNLFSCKRKLCTLGQFCPLDHFSVLQLHKRNSSYAIQMLLLKRFIQFIPQRTQ